jgi:hypothetical protein
MKTAPCWPDGTPRTTGGPFDILYQPRAAANTAPKKRGPRKSQTHLTRTLTALRDPTPSTFCTALPRKGDTENRQRISRAVI